MCHRTIYTHTCGHSIEITARCSGTAPWTDIIPKHCLPTFKLPETKVSEDVCRGCLIVEENIRRKAKEDRVQKHMEEVGKGVKLMRRERGNEINMAEEKEVMVAEEKAEMAREKAETAEENAKLAVENAKRSEETAEVAEAEANLAVAKSKVAEELKSENARTARKIVEDMDESPLAEID